MKRFYFTTVLLLLPLLLTVLSGCEDLFTKCGPFPDRYRIRDYTLTALRVSSHSVPGPADTLRIGEVRWVVSGTLDLFFSYRSGGLGTEAWACSPVDPTPTEQISSLEITSDEAYTARHPAGVSLNDLFRITHLEGAGSPPDTLSVPDFLNRPDRPAFRTFTLLPRQAPDRPGPHRISVKIRLANGREFLLGAGRVVIKD